MEIVFVQSCLILCCTFSVVADGVVFAAPLNSIELIVSVFSLISLCTLLVFLYLIFLYLVEHSELALLH